MNEKFNKNAKVEKFTTMLGIAVRLIVIVILAEKRSYKLYENYMIGLNLWYNCIIFITIYLFWSKI